MQDDVIYRQAAIEKNEMLYRDARDDTSYMIIGYNHALSDMKAIIKSLPSAQTERKKGRWTVTKPFITCSECGETFILRPQNYCPNCGARMEGE